MLAWLGAAPAVASVIVLEGVSRLMNGAGQFIPGKLGITEAATRLWRKDCNSAARTVSASRSPAARDRWHGARSALRSSPSAQ